MEKEIWKDILGYEGLYQASTMGRIRSMDRKVIRSDGQIRNFKSKIIKPVKKIKNNETLFVSLSKNNRLKTYTVHKLVMLAFKGERPEGCQICHGNGDVTDNRLDNLRYDIPSENAIDMYRYGGKSGAGKLSIEQVLEIRRLYKTGNYKQKDLVEMFGVNRSSICAVINRVSFPWLNDDGTINESKTQMK